MLAGLLGAGPLPCCHPLLGCNSPPGISDFMCLRGHPKRGCHGFELIKNNLGRTFVIEFGALLLQDPGYPPLRRWRHCPPQVRAAPPHKGRSVVCLGASTWVWISVIIQTTSKSGSANGKGHRQECAKINDVYLCAKCWIWRRLFQCGFCWECCTISSHSQIVTECMRPVKSLTVRRCPPMPFSCQRWLMLGWTCLLLHFCCSTNSASSSASSSRQFGFLLESMVVDYII